MSTETDNFINELKFDVIMDGIKKFFSRYFKYILIIITLLLLFFLLRFLSHNYKRNQMQTYNSMIFESLVSDDPVSELEKLYADTKAPDISRTLAGLNLIGRYAENLQNKDKIIQIYNDIFSNEKDLYLKYYSGLNLLIFMLNDKSTNNERINELILKLESEENPLLNLVKEQKVLFFVKLKKYTEAKTLLEDLLANKNLNESFRERLNHYLNYIQRKINENE